MPRKRRNPKGLNKRIVKDYEPNEFSYSFHGQLEYTARRRPLFYRLYHVPAMLDDARIQLSLMVLKGMITSLSRFYVDMGDAESIGDKNAEIKEFVTKQVTRYWMRAADRALTAMDWGWFAAEVLYKTDEQGRFVFHDFSPFRHQDVLPVTLENEFVGIELREGSATKFLGGQKAFWHVHWRSKHRWWGESRLRGAFDSWHEIYDGHGALDVRRLFYYKYVMQSEIVRHPDGIYFDEQGRAIKYQDVARDMGEKRRNGAVIALPSTADPQTGEKHWDIEYVGPTGSSAVDIREYLQDLRREMTEGIGLSEEIFQAAETGSGFSGRKIPETATRGHLQDVVYWMISDFDEQILRPLVRLNFDIEPDYEIVPFGLADREDDNEPEAVEMEGQEGRVPAEAKRKAATPGPNGHVRLAV